MVRVARLIPVLDFGGVETTFEIQAEHLDRGTFDLHVVTFWKAGAAAERIRRLGVEVTDLGVDPSVRNPSATAALWFFLRRVRPQILHSSIGEANFHAALAGPAARVPVTIIEENGVPNRRRASRAIHSLLYRRVDAIVAVSEASRTYLIEREHAPAARIRVIPNSPSQSFFDPVVPTPPAQPFRILCVGRLVEVKNHHRLIEAFATIPRSVNARLDIIGEGPLRAELTASISRLDLADRVGLLGFRTDIREQIDRSHLFVLPSRSEGFGVALVEAMARGRPVLAANVGALPSLLGPGHEDRLVPPEDVAAWTRALRRVIEAGDAERVTLGRQMRERAEHYTPTRQVRALESLYRETLQVKRTP